jgi:hypothetical protein
MGDKKIAQASLAAALADVRYSRAQYFCLLLIRADSCQFVGIVVDERLSAMIQTTKI